MNGVSYQHEYIGVLLITLEVPINTMLCVYIVCVDL